MPQVKLDYNKSFHLFDLSKVVRRVLLVAATLMCAIVLVETYLTTGSIGELFYKAIITPV